MSKHGPKQSKMVQIVPKWSNMVQYGPKWSQMFQNGPIWSRIVQNGPMWSQIVNIFYIYNFFFPIKTTYKSQRKKNPLPPPSPTPQTLNQCELETSDQTLWIFAFSTFLQELEIGLHSGPYQGFIPESHVFSTVYPILNITISFPPSVLRP